MIPKVPALNVTSGRDNYGENVAPLSPTSSKFASPLETFRRPSATAYSSLLAGGGFDLPRTVDAPYLQPLPPAIVGLSGEVEATNFEVVEGNHYTYIATPRAVTTDAANESSCTGRKEIACDLQTLWDQYGDNSNPWAHQIMKWARTVPDKDAYVWLDGNGNISRKLSFKDVATTVYRIGHFLKNDLNLGIGDRVVLCYPPCLDFIPAFFACIAVGVVAIPVYPPDPTRASADCARFHAICESANVTHILTNTLYSRVSILLPTLARDPRWSRLRWWNTCSVIDKKLTLSDSTEKIFPHLNPTDVAFLQFTSGSTGNPKGVMVSTGGLLHNAHLCCVSFGFPSCLDDPNTHSSIDEVPYVEIEKWFHEYRDKLYEKKHGHNIRVFSWLPVYHDMGLIGFVVTPYLFGGSCFQLSPIEFIRKPHLWMECMSKYNCLCTAGPNFAFELAAKKTPDDVFDRLNLSHVCGILCGAEPIRRRTVGRFMNKFSARGLQSWTLRPAYGLAENTLIVTGPDRYDCPVLFVCLDSHRLRREGVAACRGGYDRFFDLAQLCKAETTEQLVETDAASCEDDEGRSYCTVVSCGRAKAGVDVRIIDPDTKVEAPSNIVGEIWVRSSSLALGYFGAPVEAQECFHNTCYARLKRNSIKHDEVVLVTVEDGEQIQCTCEHGYFRTGDAGFMLCDNLFVVGRLKDVIIIRGKNYFPQDIETEIETVPRIREGCTAAFAVEIDGEEKLGVAVEIREEKATGISAKLANFIARGPRMDDEVLMQLAKDIKGAVSGTMGLDIAVLWICRPKTLHKTSSGKLRRSVIRDALLFSKVKTDSILYAPPEEILLTVSPPMMSRKVAKKISTVDISPVHDSVYPHVQASSPEMVAGETSEGIESSQVTASALPIITSDATSTVMAAETSPDAAAQKRHMIHQKIIEAADECLPVQGYDETAFDTPLFELGVESVNAISFVEALSEKLERSLDPSILFEFPTLKSLEDFFVTESVGGLMKTEADKLTAFSSNAPIYIFGLAGRFPGSSRITTARTEDLTSPPSSPLEDVRGVEETIGTLSPSLNTFWENLESGVNGVTEVPLDRWVIDQVWTPVAEPLTAGKIYTRGGGFIQDAEYFDNTAFHLASREVEQIDPQQRLALECCVDAVWNAGLHESDVKHARIGTYFGCCSSDWVRHRAVEHNWATAHNAVAANSPVKGISVYTSAAFAPSLIANRVSFVLGLTGPSMVMDTACSSSLVALDAAAHHLRDGKCEGAFVGGVNMMLTPEVSAMLCKANMLSRDSRCKTFDARADGYARGEGIGCLFLSADLDMVKRLAHRECSQSSLPLAVLRGVVVNHGGVAAGLTVPNVSSHADVLSAALFRARVPGRDVEFVECHGTGTKLGDPIELKAIREVYGKGRGFQRPLVLGAVKSHIGHLEGAAGIAGIIKAVGALIRGVIPANLHLLELNPLLNTEGCPLVFPRESYKWSQDNPRRFAGVSSFGFGGTNAHCVLQAYEPGMFGLLHKRADANTQEQESESSHASDAISESLQVACSASETPTYDGVVDFKNRPRRLWRRRPFVWNNLVAPTIGCEEESTAEVFVSRTYLRSDVTGLLVEHVVNGVAVAPAAFMLEHVKAIVHSWELSRGTETSSLCHLNSVDLERPLFLIQLDGDFSAPPTSLPPIVLLTTINENTGQVTLQSTYTSGVMKSSKMITNMVAALDKNSRKTTIPVSAFNMPPAAQEIDITAFYEETARKGLQLGKRFQVLKRLYREKSSSLAFCAEIGLYDDAVDMFGEGAGSKFEQAFFLHPGVLDGVMQLSGLTVAAANSGEDLHDAAKIYVPLQMSDVWLGTLLPGEKLFARVQHLKNTARGGEVSITLYSMVTKQPLFRVGRLQVTSVAFFVPVDIPKDLLWSMVDKPLEPIDADSQKLTPVSSPIPQDTENAWLRISPEHHDSTCVDVPPEVVVVHMGAESSVADGPSDLLELLPSPSTLVSRVLVCLDGIDIAVLPWYLIAVCQRIMKFERRYFTAKCKVVLLTRDQRSWPSIQAVRRCLDFEMLSEGSAFSSKLFALNILAHDHQLSETCWETICAYFDKGELELSMTQDDSFQAPRLESYSTPIVGTLIEVPLDAEKLKPRLLSAAAINPPREGEVQVSVHTFGLRTPCESVREVDIWFAGVVTLVPKTSALMIGDRVVGEWGRGRSLKSMGCVEFSSANIKPFSSQLTFEAAVVEALNLPVADTCQQRSFQLIKLTDEEAFGQWHATISKSDQITVLQTPSIFASSIPNSASSNDTVVITGGLGAIGLKLAKWLVGQGVQSIVCLSRRAVLSPEKAASNEAWGYLMMRSRLNVRIMRCDIADEASVTHTFEQISREGMRVVGIFHAAGVLADKLLTKLTVDDLDATFGPKVTGMLNLHKACQQFHLEKDLRFFVAFSSLASVTGNMKQVNYAMANAMMDAIVQARQSQGLCCSSIAWGPWSGDGMAAGLEPLSVSMGIRPLNEDLAFRILADTIIRPNALRNLVCFDIDVATFLSSRPREWKMYEELYGRNASPSLTQTQLPKKLARMSEAELYQFVRDAALSSAKKVLDVNVENIPTNVPLTDSGLDSMAAVEFRDDLSRQLGINLPVAALFDYPALDGMVDYLYADIKSKISNVPVTKTAVIPTAFGAGTTRAREGYAVVGMGCRMPRGANPDAFWQMLCDETDCVIEMPLKRFNLDHFYSPESDKPGCAYTRAGAFMDEVSAFGNVWFGISDAEARLMDPQQRMMLEVVYDAVADAGLDFQLMRQHYSDAAVYIGCCNFDWHYMEANNNPNSGSPYSCTGGSMSLVSNRVSYAFGLRGPSMTIDTACSSSLVALDAGREKLDAGNCSGIIVGGVNLMLSPQLFIGFCKTKLLSPDCACRTFDANANGYVRGEGAAALMLVPASATGGVSTDKFYAIIRGSATNHVGRGSTLTAPNGPAQRACIAEALARAGTAPSEVIFLEVHGTGTQIGDPIEAGAIVAAYGADASRVAPLVLGAIKTNIGHLEGGAGVAGLLKTILVLHNKVIPPNVHFTSLNPYIDFGSGNDFLIPKIGKLVGLDDSLCLSENHRLPSRIYGAVSSFGFGGANAHVIVEALPRTSFTESEPHAVSAFFTGQGSQFVGMGARLLRYSTVFAEEMERLDKSFGNLLDDPAFSESIEFVSEFDDSSRAKIRELIATTPRSVMQEIYENSHSATLESHPVISQVSVIMIELAMLAHLKSRVEIYDVLGHSLGEFMMLVASGLLPPDAVLSLVTARALITAMTSPDYGSETMVAVKASRTDLEATIRELALTDSAGVAAENGPSRSVLSGDFSALQNICKAMKIDWERRVKVLPVSRAFHSPMMRSTANMWERYLTRVRPFDDADLAASELKSMRFHSTVTGGVVTPNELLSHEYWVNHMLQTVLFQRAVESWLNCNYFTEKSLPDTDTPAQGSKTLIEFGPSPVLTKMAMVIEPALKKSFRTYDLNSCMTNVRKTEMHTWERRVHSWMENDVNHPLVGMGQNLYDGTLVYTTWMRRDVQRLFRQHRMNDVAIMPGMAFLDMVATQTAQLNSLKWREAITTVDRLELLQPTFIPPASIERSQKYKINTSLRTQYLADGTFTVEQIYEDHDPSQPERVVCRGRVTLRQGALERAPGSVQSSPKSDFKDVGTSLNELKQRLGSEAWEQMPSNPFSAELDLQSMMAKVENDQGSSCESKMRLFDVLCDASQPIVPLIYSKMAQKHMYYGPRFRVLRKLVFTTEEALALSRFTSTTDPGCNAVHSFAAEGEGAEKEDFELDELFRWHPTMLDGALQSIALLARGVSSVFVPAFMRHVTLRGMSTQERNAGIWSHARITGREEGSITAVVNLFSEYSDEKIGSISECVFKRLSLRPAYALPAHLFWRTVWDAQASSPTSSSVVEIAEQENADPSPSIRAARALPTDGPTTSQESSAALVPTLYAERLIKETAFKRDVRQYTLFEKEKESELLFFVDLTYAKDEEDGYKAYNTLIQFIKDSVIAKKTRKETQIIVVIAAAKYGVGAFAKSVNLEMAASRLPLRVVSIETGESSSQCISEYRRLVTRHPSRLRETQMRFVQGAFEFARLTAAPSFEADGGPTELWMSKRGTLKNLIYRPLDLQNRVVPDAGEVEIRVLAVGLNFRDVLNVMDLYPGDPGLPGADMAGFIVRTGAGVENLHVGDPVFGLGQGALKSYLTTSALLVAKIPSGWTFEEASSLPVAQITVEYCFSDIAGMSEIAPFIDDSNALRQGGVSAVPFPSSTAKESTNARTMKASDGQKLRVLIHAGSGAVGLYAIQYCQLRRDDVEIYCTCGSEEKVDYLRRVCGVSHIFSSRDSDSFGRELKSALNGQKLDVVLNSLAGGFIDASVENLRDDGFFLELGKLSVWSVQKMKDVKPDVTYRLVAVDTMIERDLQWYSQQLARLCSLAANHAIKPIKITLFPAKTGQNAFRYLQKAKHIGKVVITFPHISTPQTYDNDTVLQRERDPETTLNQSAVVITGGLGGLGLLIGHWLATEQGIKNIIMLSRNTALKSSDEKIVQRYNELKRLPANFTITFQECDVADIHSVRSVFENFFGSASTLKLAGIVHSAGVLNDKPLANMRTNDFRKPFPAKMDGLRNLSNVLGQMGLEENLEFFVTFSSISALLGNHSQANYATANAMMHDVIDDRRHRGLKGQAIEWGPWTEQGMAHALSGMLQAVGFKGVDNDVGLRVLFDVIQHQDQVDVLGVESVKWRTYFEQYGNDLNGLPPFFEYVVKDASLSGSQERLNKDILELAMSPGDLKKHVHEVVIQTARQVTGRQKDELDLDQPITESGIDSLAAVEFGNELSSRLGVKLTATTLFDYPTLNGIAEFCYEKISASLADTVSAQPGAREVAVEEGNQGITEMPAERATGTHALAIIGASCRMPRRSWTLDEFWDMMMNKEDCVRFIPESRFDVNLLYNADNAAMNRCYVREASFVDDLHLFDTGFFNLSASEVTVMDPQQRVFLEVGYECLLDARITRKMAGGKNIGVYVGCCNFDWHCTDVISRCDSTFSSTGVAGSLVANRLSYVLGLVGPSVVMDTACSSSLVALDAAFNKLSIDDSIEGILVGGVNVITAPHAFIAFCKTRMLAPDGRCKTFDATANGYGRGEGCGCIYVTARKNARKQRIHAIIRGSAVNHDGRSASLTAPNGRSQRAVLQAALNKASITPSEVVCVELHGTGTALGDPIEAAAIRTVYLDPCRSRGQDSCTPLVFGAVKTNLGHLEGAAGIAGVLKAILVLKHKMVPPFVHYRKLNPHIKLDGVKYIIPADEAVDLEMVCNRVGRAKPRFCIGVSSFGFGGANAHVILEESSKRASSWPDGEQDHETEKGVVFLFTGQGSQYVGMGKQLYADDEVFRETVDVVLNLFGEEERKVIMGAWLSEEADAEPTRIDETYIAQLALFALEYGLYMSLKKHEIHPSMLIGHSLGEVVAATVSGVFTLDDACKLAKERAKAMNKKVATEPAMAAIRASEEDALAAIKGVYDGEIAQVSVAAVNGPKSIVLSGNKADIVTVLDAMNVAVEKARFLPVSNAFHSVHMTDAAARIGQIALSLQRAAPAPLSPNIISTVTGTDGGANAMTEASYWSQQITSPVRFAAAIQKACELGGNIFVELGPKPTLINLGRLAAPSDHSAQWMSALNVDGHSFAQIIRAIKGNEGHVWDHQPLAWPAGTFNGGPASGECNNNLLCVSEPTTEVLSEGTRELSAAQVHTVLVDCACKVFPDLGETFDMDAPLIETLLGADSLAAVDFREKLTDALGVDVPVTILFDHGTMREVENALVSLKLGENHKKQMVKMSPLFVCAKSPIAVCGVGCRFPRGVNSPADFWRAITTSTTSFARIPLERYNTELTKTSFVSSDTPVPPLLSYSTVAALLGDPGVTFPANHYRMSAREALLTDPQQRLVLICAEEALIRGNYASYEDIAGSNTAVYIGCTDSEWQLMVGQFLNDETNIGQPWHFVGSAMSIMANRVSHVFKTTGPSATLDSGCASFFSAFSAGADALRMEKSRMALAGGVSLILSPMTTAGLCQLKYLSPTDHVAPFDASANGTLRGEGCCVFLLRKLSDCLPEKDRIFAIVRGIDVNTAGGASTLTAFHTPAQESIMSRTLYNCAQATTNDIDFVEAHATGIPLADAVELTAIKRVFAEAKAEKPLYLTSVHPYMGHSNGCLGAAQMLKAVLSLYHQQVPALRTFTKPHPFLDLKNFAAEFPTVPVDLSNKHRPLAALVNSFGMGGSSGCAMICRPTSFLPDETVWENVAATSPHLEAAQDFLSWTNPMELSIGCSLLSETHMTPWDDFTSFEEEYKEMQQLYEIPKGKWELLAERVTKLADQFVMLLVDGAPGEQVEQLIMALKDTRPDAKFIIISSIAADEQVEAGLRNLCPRENDVIVQQWDPSQLSVSNELSMQEMPTSVFILPDITGLGIPYVRARRLFELVKRSFKYLVCAREIVCLSTVFTATDVLFARNDDGVVCDTQPVNWTHLRQVCSPTLFGHLWLCALLERTMSLCGSEHRRVRIVRSGIVVDDIDRPHPFILSMAHSAIRLGKIPRGAPFPVTTTSTLAHALAHWDPRLARDNVLTCLCVAEQGLSRELAATQLSAYAGRVDVVSLSEVLVKADGNLNEVLANTVFRLLSENSRSGAKSLAVCTEGVNLAGLYPQGSHRIRLRATQKSFTLQLPVIGDTDALVGEAVESQACPTYSEAAKAAIDSLQLVKLNLRDRGRLFLKQGLLTVAQRHSLLESLTHNQAVLPTLVEDPIFILGIDRLANLLLASALWSDTENFSGVTFGDTLLPFGNWGSIKFNEPMDWVGKIEEIRATKRETNVYINDMCNVLHDIVGAENAALFPSSASSLWEDTLLMEGLGVSPSYCMKFGIDNLEYVEEHANALYDHHRLTLRLIESISARKQGSRLVLTSPYHLLGLEGLLRTYPKSKVVFVSRDPAWALRLNCLISECFQRQLVAHANTRTIHAQQSQILMRSVSRAEQLLHSVEREGRLFTLTAGMFCDEPEQTLASIREFTGLPPSRAWSMPTGTYDLLFELMANQVFTYDVGPKELGLSRHISYLMKTARRDSGRSSLSCAALTAPKPTVDEKHWRAMSKICARKGITMTSLDHVDKLMEEIPLFAPARPDPRVVLSDMKQGTLPAILDPIPRLDDSGTERILLVTGCTGFFGRHLLVHLIRSIANSQNGEQRPIVCAIRGENGLQRLQQMLQPMGITWRSATTVFAEEGLDVTLRVLQCDLTLEKWGLEDLAYDTLARNVHDIYHCAGKVALLADYSALEASNVTTTLNILRFCARCPSSPTLHHMSSAAVFSDVISSVSDVLSSHRESENPMSFLDMDMPVRGMGYYWSKHISEYAVVQASQRIQMPIAIYRLPHMIMAQSPHFEVNQRDPAVELIKIFLDTGCVPDAAFGLMSNYLADEVAANVVRLAATEGDVAGVVAGSSLKYCYHLTSGMDSNAERESLINVLQSSNILGVIADLVDNDTFYRKAVQRGHQDSFAMNFFLLVARDNSHVTKTIELAAPLSPSKILVNSARVLGRSYAQQLSYSPSLDTWTVALRNMVESGTISSDAGICDLNAFELMKRLNKSFCREERSVCSVVPANRNRTILKDEDFVLEPMQIVRQEVAQSTLSPMGRLVAKLQIAQWYCNLAAMEKVEAQVPSLLNSVIAPHPVFVVGLNRSGTTFLYHALSRDLETFRAPTLMELRLPYGQNGQMSAPRTPKPKSYPPHIDERYEDCKLQLLLTTPERWTDIHQSRPELPEEDYLIFDHVVRSLSLPIAIEMKEYQEWLLADDYAELKRAYPFHKRFLQHLQVRNIHQLLHHDTAFVQLQRETPRWLIKGPFHMLTMETLFATYPDAKIVYLQRDPLVCIESWLNLVASFRLRLNQGQDENISVWAATEIRRQAEMYKRFHQFRHTRQDLQGRILTIECDEMLRDPYASVERVYEFIGCEPTACLRKRIIDFQETDKKYRISRKVEKRPLQHFDVTEHDVRQAFGL